MRSKKNSESYLFQKLIIEKEPVSYNEPKKLDQNLTYEFSSHETDSFRFILLL